MKLVSDPTHRAGTGWLQQRLMGGIVCIYKHFWGVRAFCFALFLVEPVFCSAFFALLFPKESFTFPNIGTFAASTCTYQFHVSYKAEGLHCFLYFFTNNGYLSLSYHSCLYNHSMGNYQYLLSGSLSCDSFILFTDDRARRRGRGRRRPSGPASGQDPQPVVWPGWPGQLPVRLRARQRTEGEMIFYVTTRNCLTHVTRAM